jgi:hypothetical protein
MNKQNNTIKKPHILEVTKFRYAECFSDCQGVMKGMGGGKYILCILFILMSISWGKMVKNIQDALVLTIVYKL